MADAAKAIGVSWKQVDNWITRPGAPDSDSVTKIAKGLGCNYLYLHEGIGPRFPGDAFVPNAYEALRLRRDDWTPTTRRTFMKMAEVAPYDFTVGDWVRLGDDLDRTIRSEKR